MFRARISLIIFFCLATTVGYAGDFTLTSPTIKSGAFLPEEQVFNGFGCSGKNLSPALKWTSGLKGTKSYAITVYDPGPLQYPREC